MTVDKEKSSPVNLDLAARAEARLDIKAEIPASSVGRLVEAFTDIFRPFTEARGLKADQIRLQREDVLIEIGKRARERSNIEGAEIKPVPLKFLVPFLEKASLESLEGELIDRWSNLLLQASLEFGEELLVFIDILSKIGPREVDYLNALFCKINQDDSQLLWGHEFNSNVFEIPDLIRSYVATSVQRRDEPFSVQEVWDSDRSWPDKYEEVRSSCKSLMNAVNAHIGWPAAICHMIVHIPNPVPDDREGTVERIMADSDFSEKSTRAFSILKYHGLIELMTERTKLFAGEECEVTWCQMTPLGAQLMARISNVTLRRDKLKQT